MHKYTNRCSFRKHTRPSLILLPELATNQKIDDTKFTDMTSSSILFYAIVFIFVRFSYWSKFHINIITGTGVMRIFIYKELTKILETGNTLVWVLTNIWRYISSCKYIVYSIKLKYIKFTNSERSPHKIINIVSSKKSMQNLQNFQWEN